MIPSKAERHVLMTLVMSAAIVAAFVWPRHTAVTVCTVRAVTGFPCPGCGLTRSVMAITDGRFTDAARFHAFGFLAVAGILGLWTYGVVSLFRPLPSPFSFLGVKSAVAFFVVLATYIGYWVVRIMHGTAL